MIFNEYSLLEAPRRVWELGKTVDIKVSRFFPGLLQEHLKMLETNHPATH